jgi:hypothetical protein
MLLTRLLILQEIKPGRLDYVSIKQRPTTHPHSEAIKESNKHDKRTKFRSYLQQTNGNHGNQTLHMDMKTNSLNKSIMTHPQPTLKQISPNHYSLPC